METGRGDAAAATWIIRETIRGDAAAAIRIVHGGRTREGGSVTGTCGPGFRLRPRPRRGYSEERRVERLRYAPQLRVYGVNASAAEGRAVVDEPLVEARDAAIAVGAVEATLSALLGPSDAIVGAAADETAERPDEPDADDASAGSCGNPPPAPAADGYLDVPPAERLEAPPATPEPPPPPPRREELPPRAQKRRANSRLYASAGGGGGFIGGR